MSVRSDGVNYVTTLSETLADPSITFNELVLTGETYLTVGSFTDYSSVSITALSSAPDPPTWVLLGAGLLLLAVPFARQRQGHVLSGPG